MAGADSNVFLSDQSPESSLIVQTTIDASVKTAAAKRHRLTLAVAGQHRHYFQFRSADRLFVDSALSYRFAASRSVLVGLVQTTSYARMQLFDTEGNTLPRKLFSSWSSETRGYSQLVAGRSLTTLAAGIRVRDVNETEAQDSLDQNGYFTSLDASYRFQRSTFTLGYEYAVMHYDDLFAAARPGSSATTSPLLTLVQNAIRSRIDLSFGTWLKVGLDARQRWAVDPFEGDLTYRQTDVTPFGQVRLPMALVWDASVGYRTRVYTVRDAYERFLIVDSTLRKSWTAHWASTLQFQFLRKASSVPGDEFRERLLMFGVSATL
ncbi:MAG: hypothetical protein ACOYXU_06355 [Nitrospirota bacterium]